MTTDKRGDLLLGQRPRRRTSECACCHGQAYGARFCRPCKDEHGSQVVGHYDDAAWTSKCPYAQAFSQAYAARIAAMPSQAPGDAAAIDKNIALEPMWVRRNGVRE